MKTHYIKSLPAIAVAALLGLAGCASNMSNDNSSMGASSTSDGSPKYTQCSPRFPTACRS